MHLDKDMRPPVPFTTLRNKVVLIGNSADQTSDKVLAPDRNRPFPGVLIHACAAYTLMRSPLYEPTFAGRVAADLVLVLLLLMVVTGSRLWHVKRDLPDPSRQHLDTIHNWLTAAILLITFAGGVILVYRTRIVWDDFPLVAIGLLCHQPVEKFLHKLVHRRHTAGEAGDPVHGHGSAGSEENAR